MQTEVRTLKTDTTLEDERPRKLPELTFIYWIAKILATTFGEMFADKLSQTLQMGYLLASLLLLGNFFISLGFQLCTTRYIPVVYWSVIIILSFDGTTISDFMDQTMHLGYATGMGILLGILVSIFAVWKSSGLSLSVSTHARLPCHIPACSAAKLVSIW